MHLLKLPTETLLAILLHLPGYTVERVAQAFNRRLTSACLSLLVVRHRVWERKNARRMQHTFAVDPGEACLSWVTDMNHVSEGRFVAIGLGVFGAYSEPRAPGFRHCFDYLDLRDDLAWMDGLDAPAAGRNLGAHQAEKLAALEVRAEKLGLAVPRAFLMAMRDERWRRIPAGHDIGFDLGSPVRVHQTTGPPGCIVRFWTDQPDRVFSYLYLDTERGHCVLATDVDWHEDPEKNIGDVRTTNPLENKRYISSRGLDARLVGSLEGTSFEAWLVETYFHEWALNALEAVTSPPPVQDVPRPLLDYVLGVYTEEGRRAMERGVVPTADASFDIRAAMRLASTYKITPATTSPWRLGMSRGAAARRRRERTSCGPVLRSG